MITEQTQIKEIRERAHSLFALMAMSPRQHHQMMHLVWDICFKSERIEEALNNLYPNEKTL